MLGSDLNGKIYVFGSDVDNQTVTGATVGATYNSYDPLGMTQIGSTSYAGFETSNLIARFSATGAYLSTEKEKGDIAHINKCRAVLAGRTAFDMRYVPLFFRAQQCFA